MATPRRPLASPLVCLSLLLTLGCAGDAPSAPTDDDGDGLLSDFEAQVGTQPDQADSDGDGCDDALEVLSYFDPLNAEDRPYQGVYPRGPRPDDAAFAEMAETFGAGFDTGQQNTNWTLLDQHGEAVELYDLYGQVVLLLIAREWCEPCQEEAVALEPFYQEHKDRGFVVLNLMLEGIEDDSPPQTDRWAEYWGLSYPILGDHSPGDYTQTEAALHYIDTPGLGYDTPNHTLLDRQLRTVTLYDLNGLDADKINGLIDTPVPEVDVLLPENADALRAELGLNPDSWLVSPELCEG
ncbi:MAG: redoxin domain-containing protein [Deltaproteobacteria bacterium]|nr:redoxin domain-containing protein [Deltaproteobacteria bacterium]